MKEATGRLNPSDAEPTRHLQRGPSAPARVERRLCTAVRDDGGRRRRRARGCSALAGGWTVSGTTPIRSGRSPVGQRDLSRRRSELGSAQHRPGVQRHAFNRNAAQQLSMNIRTLPPDFARPAARRDQYAEPRGLQERAFGGERALQVRAEAFNALDHVQFAGPQIESDQRDFGRVTASPTRRASSSSPCASSGEETPMFRKPSGPRAVSPSRPSCAPRWLRCRRRRVRGPRRRMSTGRSIAATRRATSTRRWRRSTPPTCTGCERAWEYQHRRCEPALDDARQPDRGQRRDVRHHAEPEGGGAERRDRPGDLGRSIRRSTTTATSSGCATAA